MHHHIKPVQGALGHVHVARERHEPFELLLVNKLLQFGLEGQAPRGRRSVPRTAHDEQAHLPLGLTQLPRSSEEDVLAFPGVDEPDEPDSHGIITQTLGSAKRSSFAKVRCKLLGVDAVVDHSRAPGRVENPSQPAQEKVAVGEQQVRGHQGGQPLPPASLMGP